MTSDGDISSLLSEHMSKKLNCEDKGLDLETDRGSTSENVSARKQSETVAEGFKNNNTCKSKTTEKGAPNTSKKEKGHMETQSMINTSKTSKDTTDVPIDIKTKDSNQFDNQLPTGSQSTAKAMKIFPDAPSENEPKNAESYILLKGQTSEEEEPGTIRYSICAAIIEGFPEY